MKKILSAVLAGGLLFNAAGMAGAQTPEIQAAAVQPGTIEEALNTINSLNASVFLADAKYQVKYSEEKGKVNIHIQKQSGNQKIEVTEEQAIERIEQFVSNLELNSQMSKKEIIDRISDALGVEPGDVQHAKAQISFDNGSQASLLYVKGNKESHPLVPKNVNVKLEADGGEFVHLKLSSTGDKVAARFEMKTAEGIKEYKGWAALAELEKLGVSLYPDEEADLKGYYNLYNLLGVQPDEISKVDIKLSLSNQTKFQVNYIK